MDEKNIKQRPSKKRVVPINIRITKEMSAWLKEKKFSPTGIFMEACKELGYKGDEK